jgi:hypothetical protein
MFAWGRIGLVSSAEGFVLLSGVVVGMVYKKRLANIGLWNSSIYLWKRAFSLYRLNILVIISISLLTLVPFIDVFELTHWTNPSTHESFALFPPEGTPLLVYVSSILLLKVGPHQFQVMGLYVLLLTATPAILYLLKKNNSGTLLLISWLLYGSNHYLRLNLTGSQYEMAFPSLTWQLLFIHGMFVGYKKDIIIAYILSAKGRLLLYSSVALVVLFIVFANNRESNLFWPWGHLNLVSAQTFGYIYDQYFQKSNLGLGRLLNNLALLITSYVLLSRYWSFSNKLLGWLLIPLGTNSLYVFTLHLFFILILSNSGLPELNNFMVNSALHLFVVLAIWLMVKKKVLFTILPR